MKRYCCLDALRGLCVVNMVAYHALWDLVFLRGVRLEWYMGAAGKLWQSAICFTFILLSGFCCGLGRRRLRRGLVVSACGGAVTAATLIFSPENRIIFGILTLLGACMLLAALLEKPLGAVPPAVGTAVSLALFALTYNINLAGRPPLNLPRRFYANLFTAWLGLPPEGFFSTDYFPLLPWSLLFFAGYFIYKAAESRGLPLPEQSLCPPLEWAGRHSLVIYMLHQPLLFLLFGL